MKKLVLLALAVVLCLSLVACGQKDTSNDVVIFDPVPTPENDGTVGISLPVEEEVEVSGEVSGEEVSGEEATEEEVPEEEISDEEPTVEEVEE